MLNREISCFRGDLISRLQTKCFFRGDLISRLKTKCFFRGDLISRILSFNRETAKISHIKVTPTPAVAWLTNLFFLNIYIYMELELGGTQKFQC